MANEKHLLVTAGGSYLDSTLSTEFWQVTLRFGLWFGGVPDSVGTLPNNWDVVADSVSRVESLWTIDGNWNISAGSPPSFSVDDWLNDQLAPAFTAWMGASGISTKCQLDYLKVAPIGAPSGHYIPAPPYAAGSPMTLTWTSSNPVGGNANSHLPLQVAAVVSHRTPQVGRRGRGRMYRPGLTTGATGTDGQFASTFMTSILAAQVALLEDSNVELSTPYVINTRPIITGAPWDKYGIISAVSMDQVPDTQRRRTDSLTRTVTTSPVSY